MRSFIKEELFKEDVVTAITSFHPLDMSDVKEGGVIVSSNINTVKILNQDMHTLILGSSGSKKTRNVGLPTLLSIIQSKESFLIHDCKNEYYPYVSSFLEKQGYEVIVLNTRDMLLGKRYNPFDLCKKYAQKKEYSKSNLLIREVAQSLYNPLLKNSKEAFWSSMAMDYFCGLAQLLRDYGKDDITIANVRNLHDVTCSNNVGVSKMHTILSKLDDNYSAKKLISSVIYAPSETRGGLYATFCQPLNFFVDNEAIEDLFFKSEFDIETIMDKPTAIFLVFPEEKRTFDPILTMFIKQVYEVLIEKAMQKKSQRLETCFHFLLDEFCNLPFIEDFSAKISASRSRNIRFILFVQSYSQLVDVYGKSKADILMSNCGLWMILRSKEYDFVSNVAKYSGTKHLYYSNSTIPLLTPLMIQSLNKEKGEVLVVVEGSQIMYSTLLDISKYPFNLKKSTLLPFKKASYRNVFQLDKLEINISRKKEEEKEKMSLLQSRQNYMQRSKFIQDLERLCTLIGESKYA